MLGRSPFLQGFAVSTLALGVFFLAAQILMWRVGEVDLDSIMDRQSSDPKGLILFSSGLDQNVALYKLRLVEKAHPDVIAVGSSRSMQVRKQFFKTSFINMGGAVNSVSQLDFIAGKISALEQKPKLVLLFVDPWWFNANSPRIGANTQVGEFPNMVSASMVYHAAALLRKNNWIEAANRSRNLGIHAIVTGDGFSSDGSYHYTDILSGKSQFSDVRFSSSLARIVQDQDLFAKSDSADAKLIQTACSAIVLLKKSSMDLVVIAPPFASAVSDKLSEGGYGYIKDVGGKLTRCAGGVPLFDFSSGQKIPGGSDCEFVDGFHGGDVLYARLLDVIAQNKPDAGSYFDRDFIGRFIERNTGFAGGVTRESFLDGREADFLGLGCPKKAGL